MFRKAQEVLYNYYVQPKAQLLKFLGENPIARVKIAVVLILSSLTSIQYFASTLSYKSPIEVLLAELENLLKTLQLLLSAFGS